MSEPNEHERVVELLKQARRPETVVTPERLEENLRWLVRSTRPEMKAPEALRQRVQGMAAAQRARRPSLFARFLTEALPVRRQPLAGAVCLAVACVALFLLLTSRAPAQMLARTLQAMAQIRSAHCTGWHAVYRPRGEGRPAAQERMRVEWWYKAPNWYRNEMEAVSPGGEIPSTQLIVKGDRNVLVNRLGTTSKRVAAARPLLLARYLSSLDFFSRRGLLRRAEAEKAGQVAIHEETFHDRPVQIIEVKALEPQATGEYRARWVLCVDPSSDLILQSETHLERQERDGTWQILEEEVLEHLDYNVPVKDSLFDVEPPTLPRRPDSP